MQSIRRLAACTLFILPVCAGAFTLGGGGDPLPLDRTQKFDLAADPKSLAETYVATQAEGKLKNIKRIAITNMCVQFISGKEASGFSSGATRGYTRTASAAIPGGLDPAKMQAVADAWLEQMESDLKAAGYDILPYDQLATNDLFRDFAAKYESGIREGSRADNNNQKGSTGEAVVFVSPRGRPFAPDCGTISPASTGTFVRMSYPLDAEFLTISGVIDLGDAKATGGLLRGASASVEHVQYIRAGDSQFQFIGKMGPGARVWLKQSIVPARDPFSLGATSTENTGSYDAATKTTTMTTTTAQAVGFDETLYYDNALTYLVAMHRMFLQKMSAR
jgi:hypothetical protein